MGLGDGRIGEDFGDNYTEPDQEAYGTGFFEGLDATIRKEEYEAFMREEIRQIDIAQNSLTRRPDISREQAITNMRTWYKKKKVFEKVGQLRSSTSEFAMSTVIYGEKCINSRR